MWRLAQPSLTRVGIDPRSLRDVSWQVASRSSFSSDVVREAGQRDFKADLWSRIEANTLLFNPRRLPHILVPAARLPKAGKEDPRLDRLLQRATKYVQNDGVVVPPVLGGKGITSVIQAAQQLKTPQARNFSLAFLGAVSAQVSQIDVKTLNTLAMELAQNRIRDTQLWRSLLDSVPKRDDLQPADIANLLINLPRAGDLGGKPSGALRWLCQAGIERCQEFPSRDLVRTLGALCRLYSYLVPDEQIKAIHLFTDRWLALQPADLETTPSKEVISLSVSLASVPGIVATRLRTDNFLSVVPRWVQNVGIPSGAITAEECIVLLWAFKVLSQLGLSRFSELVELALGRLEHEANIQAWSFIRLCQAVEVLLDVQCIPNLTVRDGSEEPALKAKALELELQVAAKLALELTQIPAAGLESVVRRGDTGGEAFWVRCAGLTDAVLDRAGALAADEAVPTAEVVSLLEKIAAPGLAKTAAFRSRAPSISGACGRRAEEPLLADVLRKFATKEVEPPTEPQPSGTASTGEAPPEKAKPEEDAPGSAFEALPVLSPLALAERIGKLGRSKSNATEVSVAAAALLNTLETLSPGDLLTCLEHVLSAGRRRVAKQPAMLDVVERIGDQVAISVKDFSSRQLIFALESFAEAGLPYHLLYESASVELLNRSSSQKLSWAQVVSILESFAAVRLWLPELAHFYRKLRRQQELARMPTMGLIRFLSAATDLELTDKGGADVRELVSRILAETIPQRPLPLEETATILQSLLNSGTVLPDKQLRHLLSWVAPNRPSHFSHLQLTSLRQFMLFILAQAEETQRASLLRMPVEMQTFVSAVLCNRMPNVRPGIPEATRQFRSQVTEMVVDDPDVVLGVQLGPGGYLDLKVGDTAWLLDGPEAFLRPFTQPLDYIAQEKRRLWLLERLLCDEGTRRSVADFFPGALQWPLLGSVNRLSWQQWEQTTPAARPRLLGHVLRSPPGGLIASPSLSPVASGSQVGRQPTVAE